MGEVKFGELKGQDVNGNKYFENLEYPFGQHRWVEYKVKEGRREEWREGRSFAWERVKCQVPFSTPSLMTEFWASGATKRVA
eukprot:evm.model.NODE_2213_length_7292_cov_34.032776.2